MGYRIFVLCLRQVLNNWIMAVRLSWFWILVAFLVGTARAVFKSYLNEGVEAGQAGQDMPGVFLFVTILGLMIVVAGMISIAIGWHRYVLRGEIPESFYVLRLEWPLRKYFWGVVKIIVILIATAIPLIIVLSYLVPFFSMLSTAPAVGEKANFTGFSLRGLVVSFILNTSLIWVLLRFGTILPAMAVGKKLSLWGSFQLTGKIAGPLFITAISVVLFQSIPAIFNLLLTSIGGPETLLIAWLIVLVTLVFSWFSFFISFGVLTVIYGHLVENKPV